MTATNSLSTTDPATPALSHDTETPGETETSTSKEGKRPSLPTSAAKKKRSAGDDWAKCKDDVSGSEDGEAEEGGSGTADFRRADEEVLSKRRIVKARRPPSMGSDAPSSQAATDEEPTAPNPFANVSLTNVKPPASTGTVIFGSGFPTVSATAMRPSAGASELGDATAQGSITRPGSGPGLGSVPAGFAAYTLNPFKDAAPPVGAGSFATSPSKRKPPSELGGSEGGAQSQFGKSVASAGDDAGDEEGGGGAGEVGEDDVEAEPNVTFDVPRVQGLKDSSYKPLTGEEGETCVLQLRSKLYRLTEVKGEEGGAGGASSASAPRRDWVETGVGQAKILVPLTRDTDATVPARVVMRREPGTSVLINTLLKEPVGAAKHADKALRLTCLDEGGVPSTFLFRFKTGDEMEQMLEEIEKQLDVARAGEKGQGGK